MSRHRILLGKRTTPQNEDITISPYGTVALIAGPSGGGKSKLTTGVLERVAAAGYQFCALDPEGDYDGFDNAVSLGNTHQAPTVDEVLQLLRSPRQNVFVNLLRVPLRERPQFCASLLPRMQELRARTGRPHWLIFDEAHHLFPADWHSAPTVLPSLLETALFITVHPREISPAILGHVNVMLALRKPKDVVKDAAKVLGLTPPAKVPAAIEKGQALFWQIGKKGSAPFVFEVVPGRTERRRHVRKYAEGLLTPERSFYFRGPEKKLNLRAHNLILFLELADGVDDGTWLHHLRAGEYSRWFEEIIGDEELGAEAREIEADHDLSAAESRQRMHHAIESRYTLPENPSLPRMGPPSRGRTNDNF